MIAIPNTPQTLGSSPRINQDVKIRNAGVKAVKGITSERSEYFMALYKKTSPNEMAIIVPATSGQNSHPIVSGSP